jgi:hypothetical protein
MNKNISISLLAVATMILASVVASPAFASMNTGHMGGMGGGWGRGNMMGSMGVIGTVDTVSGNTITVTTKARPNKDNTTISTSTMYTIDATSATVTKNGTASTVSNIATGDMIMVQGTITGTNIVAKTIHDGLPPKGTRPMANSIIQGNGQPIVAGAVTTINGNTLTITNKSNVTYTVDATNAKIATGNQASTVSNIAVGDNVIVQGTINGNAVVASSIIDQKAPTNNSQTSTSNPKPHPGFMGGIMNFFKGLFGF